MLFDEPCSYEVANKRNSTAPLNLFRGSAYTNLFSFMPLLYRSCLIYSLEIKKDSLTRKYSFAFGVAGNRKKRSINSNMIFHIANYNLFEEKEPTVGCGVTIVTSMVINLKNITELCL